MLDNVAALLHEYEVPPLADNVIFSPSQMAVEAGVTKAIGF